MRGQAAAAHLRKPPAAPPSLLDHLVWNVSQPPEAAQTLAPPADCGGCNEPAGEPAEDAWGYGGSQGSLDEGPAGLACIAPASQLQEPRAVEQRELDAVVYAVRGSCGRLVTRGLVHKGLLGTQPRRRWPCKDSRKVLCSTFVSAPASHPC